MLQEIKERVGRLVNFETASDDDLYYMSKGHINWLIKRAEEAEKLTRIAIEADEGCEYWKDKYKQLQVKVNELEQSLNDAAEMAEQFLNDKHFYMDELKKMEQQLQQAQAKAERYEQTLRRIANPKRDASKEYYRLWAKQALEGK